MSDEPDTVDIAGVTYWIHRAYRPQPKSDAMLPEVENPPDPAVTSYVCGGSWPRRTKPVVVKTYDVLKGKR